MIRNWSIAKKLTTAFAAVIVPALLYSVYVAYRMNEYEDDVYNLHQIEHKLQLSKDLQFYVVNVWQFMTDASLTKDEEVIESEAKVYVRKANEACNELIQNFRQDPQLQQELKDIRQQLKEMFETGNRMFHAYLSDWEQGNVLMEKYDTEAEQAIEAADKLVERLLAEEDAATSKMYAIAHRSLYVTLAISAVLLILGLVVSRKITLTLNEPVRDLAQAAHRVSEGDFNVTVKVTSRDEIGQLAEAFNYMIENISQLMKNLESANAEVEEAIHQSEQQRDVLARAAEQMLQAMDRFANGDLRVALESSEEGEIGRLFDGFNRAVENFRTMLQRVDESVQSTASVATQINSSTEQLASAAQEQSAQTHEIAAAVEEMNQTIAENAMNFTKAVEMANHSGKVAEEGGEIVSQTIEKIQQIASMAKESAQRVEELGNSSMQISEIVSVISEIAEQTNLLALNAAIEAARAGEQGKGFAVVADEVRKLANQTSDATSKIGAMIKNIQQVTRSAVQSMEQANAEVTDGITLADKAGNALKKIVSSTKEVVEMVQQISEATREISTASEQISRSVEAMSQVSSDSASSVGQIAEATANLTRQANELQGLLGRFLIYDERSTDNVTGWDAEEPLPVREVTDVETPLVPSDDWAAPPEE